MSLWGDYFNKTGIIPPSGSIFAKAQDTLLSCNIIDNPTSFWLGRSQKIEVFETEVEWIRRD